MYGWSGVLKLAAELLEWDDLDGIIWLESFKPLTQTKIVLLPILDSQYALEQIYPSRRSTISKPATFHFAPKLALFAGIVSLTALRIKKIKQDRVGASFGLKKGLTNFPGLAKMFNNVVSYSIPSSLSE